ncbi:MAG: hypothetical protein D6784_01635 [Chloroflexi bacterium]|nr:MAG: hypothetical protein D6784_01635 [Chloroflexota bacterium]
MSLQQVVTVTCPSCQNRYSDVVYTAVDGQDLALKYALLQGRLNISQCSRCGMVQPLNAPLFYYDLEKELAFVLSPDHLGLAGGDSQKMVGDLVNRVVNSLPTEQRRFFLFNPKQFLTMESLLKAVLEADGITEEMLQRQEEKAKLIQELLSISDKAAFKAKVKEVDDQLDRDFFEVLTSTIQAAQMNGDSETAQALIGLRQLTARLSSRGKEIVEEIDSELQTIFLESREELVEKLRTAESEEEFLNLVAAGYDMLDYTFFLHLSERIDEAVQKGDAQTEKELSLLRAKILAAKEKLDEAFKKELEQAASLLEQIVKSGDPQKTIARNIDRITPAFFSLLRANIEQARQEKKDREAQALLAIGNLASAVLREAEIKRLQKNQQSAGESPAEAEAPASPVIEIARK